MGVDQRSFAWGDKAKPPETTNFHMGKVTHGHVGALNGRLITPHV